MKQLEQCRVCSRILRVVTLCLAFVLCVNATFAQNILVKGVVVDKNTSEPIIGANVVIENTTRGSVTDVDGKFEIANVPSGSTIDVTYIGYKSYKTEAVSGKTYDIELEADSQSLDEVVVVGYEVKKKSVVTGAISSLNSDDLMQAKTSNAINALTGRVSGVNVLSNSGQPGTTPSLFIRGIGTNGNAGPLYVIDGLQGADMSNINPNDIESMEILKDATSAAIYGARAANGVVLITTKKGQKGKTTLSYDGYYGVSSAQKKPDMMNAEEYIYMVNQFDLAKGGAGNAKTTGVDTNWFDELFVTAPVQEHNVTATTGSDKGSSLFSFGYVDQNGIIGDDKSSFNRYTLRTNNLYNITDYITIGGNVNLAYTNKKGVGTGANGYNPVTYAYNMDPITPVYDPNSGDSEGYGVTQTGYAKNINPIAYMASLADQTSRNFNAQGNFFAEIKLLKDLYIKSDISTSLNYGNSRSYSHEFYHNGNFYNNESKISQGSSASLGWQWENTLRYKKSFNDHNLSVLLGTSSSSSSSEWVGAGRSGLAADAATKDEYRYIDAGDIETATNYGSASAVHSMASYFGRLSYDYKERYMAEFVVRRDGSSNFGPENQYATFPGVSVGWNVNNEEFWNVNNFDKLKLRASWGQNGNENIAGFSYTSLVNNNSYYTLGMAPTIIVGSSPASLVNPNVRWETAEQTNIGADMGFFGGKLSATVDWYKKTTKDLLFQPTFSSVYGNESPYYNVGQISNSGFEFQATYYGHIGELNYSVSGNASYLHNNVDVVGNENGYIDGGYWREATNITRMEEGHSLGYYRLYKTDGIFQSQDEINAYVDENGNKIQPDAVPGDFKWVDTNNDGAITDDDRTDCGNPWAKWTYGANITLNWKGIDFTTMLIAKTGFQVYAAQYREEGYGVMNLPSFYMDHWTPEKGGNTVPRLASSSADKNGNFTKPSDFYLYDGDYLRIGLIELGYTLPNNWIRKVNLSKVRVYAAIDNVATFSKYPFMDSETTDMRSGSNVLETGMDYSSYPLARTVRFGASIAF